MVASLAPSAPSVPVTASGEHLAAAFARLAAKGAAQGVTVEYAHTGSLGTYIASSASDPSVRYCVVIDPRSKSYGCDCEGWARYQRCKHFALALAAAGWLPEPPEPEGGAPAPRISLDPADIEAAMQRIRDNRELARIARELVVAQDFAMRVREDAGSPLGSYDADEFPVYGAPPRRPMPGDCPVCRGRAWDNCSVCCGSGFCPTCRGSGLWHTGVDGDERVIGPDGAAWICPDCAMFRGTQPAGAAAIPVVGKVAEDEPVYQVGPVEPRPAGCDGFSTLGIVKVFAARETAEDARTRRDGLPVRGEPVWQDAADALEAEWLALLRRRIADRQSN